jgi:rhamnosyltransferase
LLYVDRDSPMGLRISCVVVLFNPTNVVVELVRALSAEGYGVVVVVNAAAESILREIRMLPSVSLIDNGGNVGLGTALNVGIRYAFSVNGSDFVALFDQDSSPDSSMPAALVTELEASAVERVACIGPMLVDKKDRKACYGANNRKRPPECRRSIPTSGSVIPRAAYEAVGPMMDQLFIDGIDHEWCFRASSKGYAVLVSESTQMLHDMGDASLNYFGQYKPVHRSPVRHYYIVRNAIYLAKLSYLPLAWRLMELFKTVRRILAYLVVSTSRMRSFRMIWCAIRDGYASRMGKCSCH